MSIPVAESTGIDTIPIRKLSFKRLTSELAEADLVARAATSDASAARERKSTVAVEAIHAAFKEKLSPEDVRTQLIDAGILKGTVSKIVTVLTALANTDLDIKNVNSLNGSYTLVKQIEAAKLSAATGGVAEGAAPTPKAASTPKEALEIIIDAIKAAKDPYAAASEWLTTVTNRITTLTAELADADEEE